MTAEEITVAAQRTIFESLHRKIDVALLDRLLTRIGAIPVLADPDDYLAVLVEVCRASLQPLIDRMTFESMATSPTIH